MLFTSLERNRDRNEAEGWGWSKLTSVEILPQHSWSFHCKANSEFVGFCLCSPNSGHPMKPFAKEEWQGWRHGSASSVS